MSDHNNMKPPSLWRAEPDEVNLLALGKLIEELNECGARAARCIIQGIHETDPDTGYTNLHELTKEIADVDALLSIIAERLEINTSFLAKRAFAKKKHKQEWLEMVRIVIEAEAK